MQTERRYEMKLFLRWLLSRFYLHIVTLGVDESDVDTKVKNIAVWGTAAFFILMAVVLVLLAISMKSIFFGIIALFPIHLTVRGVRFYLKNK